MNHWEYGPYNYYPLYHPEVKIEEHQCNYMMPCSPYQPEPFVKQEVKLEEQQQKSKVPEKRVEQKKKKKCQEKKKKKQDEQEELYEKELLEELTKRNKIPFKQNKTRNFYSTIFRIFLRKSTHQLNKEEINQEILEIITSNNLSISAEQVRKAISKKNKQTKAYIRVQDIKFFFYDEQENFQNQQAKMVLRIMMKKYLKKEFFLHYKLSNNIRDGNTNLYLQTSRRFIQLFLKPKLRKLK